MEHLLPALSALSIGGPHYARKRTRAEVNAEAAVSPLAWARQRLVEAKKKAEEKEAGDAVFLCVRLERRLRTLENESVEQVQSAIQNELAQTPVDYLTVLDGDAPESLRTLVLWSVGGVREREEEEERAREEARRAEEDVELVRAWVHGGGKCMMEVLVVKPKPSRQSSDS